MNVKIAGIVRDSIVDGEGIRDVIFLQGCHHHCKGCHNPNTWNIEQGDEVPILELCDKLKGSNNDITISGGEPLDQLVNLIALLGTLKETSPTKKVWLYTGFTYEEVAPWIWLTLYTLGVDVVVDGRYEEDKKDSNLSFRGSSNQRIIDLNKTLIDGEVMIYETNLG